MIVWRYALLWVMSFVFTSLIDALWHLVLFRRSYGQGIKPLARMSGEKMAFQPAAGLLSQVLVVSGIVFLVLMLAGKGNYGTALLVGAAAGVLAISVYGVTNYALFKDWNLTLTVLELVWGPILGGLSGLFVFWARTLLLKP
jgi:uncharacterized membrane protein